MFPRTAIPASHGEPSALPDSPLWVRLARVTFLPLLPVLVLLRAAVELPIHGWIVIRYLKLELVQMTRIEKTL